MQISFSFCKFRFFWHEKSSQKAKLYNSVFALKCVRACMLAGEMKQVVSGNLHSLHETVGKVWSSRSACLVCDDVEKQLLCSLYKYLYI